MYILLRPVPGRRASAEIARPGRSEMAGQPFTCVIITEPHQALLRHRGHHYSAADSTIHHRAEGNSAYAANRLPRRPPAFPGCRRVHWRGVGRRPRRRGGMHVAFNPRVAGGRRGTLVAARRLVRAADPPDGFMLEAVAAPAWALVPQRRESQPRRGGGSPRGHHTPGPANQPWLPPSGLAHGPCDCGTFRVLRAEGR